MKCALRKVLRQSGWRAWLCAWFKHGGRLGGRRGTGDGDGVLDLDVEATGMMSRAGKVRAIAA